MNQEIRKILQCVYADHKLKDEDLDYRLIATYKSDIENLSKFSDQCFFIVDLHTLKYIYTSKNFKDIFGYLPIGKTNISASDNLLDSKIHPDDFFEYKKNLLRVGEFLMHQSKEERPYYKHVFEMRIQNIQNEYVRVSWERKSLKTDKSGNLWLMLGTIHVLSDQSDTTETKSFFINQKTGERIPFDCPKEHEFELTAREKEVLGLIQQGFLSKEIADKLSISVNTVNIHRQNILHKMQVNNSLEAVERGRKSGLLK
jgi:DNA-binding CsgD family transcriptional regulator